MSRRIGHVGEPLSFYIPFEIGNARTTDESTSRTRIGKLRNIGDTDWYALKRNMLLLIHKNITSCGEHSGASMDIRENLVSTYPKVLGTVYFNPGVFSTVNNVT